MIGPMNGAFSLVPEVGTRRSRMSRLPRHLEHLKTGFTAEAVSAACYRAYAQNAEEQGLENLAREWRSLAAEKDQMAIEQLSAAGRINDELRNIIEAITTDRYENDVLYPKLIRDSEGGEQDIFRKMMDNQQNHLGRIESLRVT